MNFVNKDNFIKVAGEETLYIVTVHLLSVYN